MADWTAITGIVVAGVVGPGVIAFAAARRQRSEAASARALADRGAARALVDEAAQAVREALGRGASLRSAVRTWGNRLGVEGGDEQVQAFKTAGQAVDLLEPRVEIMFGDESPVTVAYSDCLRALERMSQGAQKLSGAGDAIDWRPFLEDVSTGLEETRAAQRRFLRAAHAELGLT